jgi:hypothetical protein
MERELGAFGVGRVRGRGDGCRCCRRCGIGRRDIWRRSGGYDRIVLTTRALPIVRRHRRRQRRRRTRSCRHCASPTRRCKGGVRSCDTACHTSRASRGQTRSSGAQCNVRRVAGGCTPLHESGLFDLRSCDVAAVLELFDGAGTATTAVVVAACRHVRFLRTQRSDRSAQRPFTAQERRGHRKEPQTRWLLLTRALRHSRPMCH